MSLNGSVHIQVDKSEKNEAPAGIRKTLSPRPKPDSCKEPRSKARWK